MTSPWRRPVVLPKMPVGSNVVEQVAKGVVPNNQVPNLCTASGVIAKDVDVLHAQRAGDFFFQDRDSETIRNGDPKIPRSHQTVVPILGRRNCSEKATGVGLGNATKALSLPVGGGMVDEKGVHLLIKGERRFLLRNVSGRHSRRRGPRLVGGDAGLVPARLER